MRRAVAEHVPGESISKSGSWRFRGIVPIAPATDGCGPLPSLRGVQPAFPPSTPWCASLLAAAPSGQSGAAAAVGRHARRTVRTRAGDRERNQDIAHMLPGESSTAPPPRLHLAGFFATTLAALLAGSASGDTPW